MNWTGLARLWIVFFIVLLGSICARADEFSDRTARFAARTAAIKKGQVKRSHCYCGGDPSICSCDACQCVNGGDCHAAKKVLPTAPAIAYRHVCGCPSMSCNCAPLGGCHCAENAMFNRVNPVWQKSPAGGWSCWRGIEQLGYYDGTTYWPLHNGEWCEPAKAPIPLPSETSMDAKASRSYGWAGSGATPDRPLSQVCRS